VRVDSALHGSSWFENALLQQIFPNLLNSKNKTAERMPGRLPNRGKKRFSPHSVLAGVFYVANSGVFVGGHDYMIRDELDQSVQ
jgi:hypothetical protein